MRSVLVAALVLVVLLGCSVSQQAVTPSRSIEANVSAVTIEEAVAALGSPAYEHHCQDGGTTLAWKIALGQVGSQERRIASHARAVDAPSLRAIVAQPASVTGQTATLVVKFDSSGRMLWGRQLP